MHRHCVIAVLLISNVKFQFQLYSGGMQLQLVAVVVMEMKASREIAGLCSYTALLIDTNMLIWVPYGLAQMSHT